MQQRNNYELDVYNGDVGIIVQVDEDLEEIEVDFTDRRVLYPFDAADELQLAYAGTIHKAQGSEYAAVVMPLLMQHYMLLQRNVVYTGITRAKRIVVVVGEGRAVRRAVMNTEVARRHTRLAERLRAGAAGPEDSKPVEQ
jgi:exodeoxyribonuclease V alpha subunit